MANLSPDSDHARNSSKISGAMPTHEILTILRDHGCEDITQQLNLENCSQFPISNGGFGDVFKGKLQSGSPIAIKCLRITVGTNDQESQKQLRSAAHEIYIWSKCKHPNVLELKGIAQYQDRIAMISPWMENGNLSWFLTQNSTANRYTMCAEIADAVTHLHSCGIVHGDIKGANIVVSDDHTLKLVDFGTSFTSQYSLQFSGGAQSGATFTIRYTAPEIILEKSKHTMAGDVYGLGMTMLEVTTGLTPYYGVNEAAVLRRIVDGISPTQPEQFMPNDQAQANNLWALITRCWRPEPDDRPSAAEVADNMWDINLALNYGTIVSTMNLDEILTRLNLHGCKVTTNISNDFDQLLDKTPSDNVCCSTLNGKKVAIKCPKLNGSNRTLQDLAHELFVWSRCNHPNILTCMGATSLRGELAMVSPWLQNGSLLDYLARTPRRNRIKLVYELTEAVSYLRSKNIVHGDITIFNILVSDDHTLKLCGFNHARVIAYNNLQFPGLHTPKEEEVPELSFKVDRVAAVTTGLEILVGVPLSQTETQLVLQNAWVRELVQQEFWGNTLKEIHDKILRIKSRANQRKKLQPGNPPSKLRAATLLTILPSFVAVSFALLQWKEKQPSEQIALAQTALGGLLWMLWG